MIYPSIEVSRFVPESDAMWVFIDPDRYLSSHVKFGILAINSLSEDWREKGHGYIGGLIEEGGSTHRFGLCVDFPGHFRSFIANILRREPMAIVSLEIGPNILTESLRPIG